MSTTAEELREEVRRRYAESALAVTSGANGKLRRRLVLRRRARRSDVVRRGALRRRAARRAAGHRRSRLARLRQPDRRRGAARGRDRARPRLGRRHRRDPLRQAGRPDGDGLRARHDRRDARPRAAERRRGRPRERPLPEGRDRGDPAPRRLGRRRHLQLRDQPLDGQGGGADRDRPRAQAGRADRHQRRRRRGPALTGRAGRARVATSAASPGRSPKGEYEAGLEAAGFEDVSIDFTHQVADGMHGAIVKAHKTHAPEARGLPVIQPAARAGCCWCDRRSHRERAVRVRPERRPLADRGGALHARGRGPPRRAVGGVEPGPRRASRGGRRDARARRRDRRPRAAPARGRGCRMGRRRRDDGLRRRLPVPPREAVRRLGARRPPRPGRSSGCARSATRSGGASRPSLLELDGERRPGKRAPPDGRRGATEPAAAPRADEAAVLGRLSTLDRFLPLWIALAMAARARPRLADPEPERRPRPAPASAPSACRSRSGCS